MLHRHAVAKSLRSPLPLIGGADQHAAARDGRDQLVDDVLIAPEPIVGMLQVDAERMLSELLTPNSPRDSLGDPTSPRPPARGLRHYLQESEGEGYWDFFNPCKGMFISVTHATYRSDTWVRVEGDGLFKVRILLSGKLRSRSGEILAQHPEALLYVSPGASSEGYSAMPGEPLRMVVLHCRPELLTQVLQLDRSEIPAPLDSLFARERPPSCHRLALRPGATHAAQRLVEPLQGLSPTLRFRYLETLSIEILLDILGYLQSRTVLPGKSQALSSRDLSRVYEARDYLAQHYTAPPNIPELARLVGVNQTKLKMNFREVLGVTIYSFIVKCRMERAAHLLSSGEQGIAQIAYAVGYDYPANFAVAFKRYFGQLPGSWKSSARQHDHKQR